MNGTATSGSPKSIHTSPVAMKKAGSPTLKVALDILQWNTRNPNPLVRTMAVSDGLSAIASAMILTDQTVSYSFAAGACNWGDNDFGHRDRKFHGALGDLSKASVDAGSGMVSAVFVREESGKPGTEFFELWEKLRPTLPPIPRDAHGHYTAEGKLDAWNHELILLGMTARS